MLHPAVKNFLLIGCVLLCFRSSSSSQIWSGHTPPEKWKKPRIFHSSFDQKYESRISKSRVDLEPLTRKVISQNEGYWFAFKVPDFTKEGPWSTSLYVYNDRSYLVKIVFKDHGSYGVKANWINEKLLYLDVWWGRVLGSYLIYDTEKEQFLFKEMIHDRVIPFQQFQHPNKPRSER